MSPRETEPTAEIERRISEEIRGIHEQAYGQEVAAVRTLFVDDMVICVLDIRLLTHERTLLDAGQPSDHIRTVRQQFQETIRTTFAAAVEHMTGRRVIGFVSDTHVEDPPFAVEFFRLAPEVESSDQERDEGPA
ncbi:MAG TPA: Na-translocating system protein MpsC family protein [Thermoleophilaceae bacterium]